MAIETELSTDALAEKLRQEFLDEAGDVVNELDLTLGNLRARRVEMADAILDLRRRALSLRTGAKAVAAAAVEMIAHRLDDYLGDLQTLAAHQIEEIQTFCDALRDALEAREIDGDDLRQVVRTLPVRLTFDPAQITLLDIEVLLVHPQRTAARFVERELQACGYRVSNVTRSFDAIEYAVRTKPEMVISSAVLDELSGVDLACALHAMPVTHKIPFALLTSFGWGHPSLEGLPPRAAIIRKGPQFGDDLAEALARFQIT